MIKLIFLIIFYLILNVTLQQEKSYNEVFSEKYCGKNFHWFLYNHKTLEIPIALHGDPKCTQNGLESCVSVAIYHYPVGHIALSHYHRFNSESLQKTTVYKDNLLLIPYRFDKFNKENSGESNQPVLIAKDDSVGYICFFGISDKKNSIGLDSFGNINDNVNSGKKYTLMRVESQYQSQSQNYKSKLDSKNINKIYTLNTSEKSDTFLNLFRLKDFNKNIIKRDVKIINRAKIKSKLSTPNESDLRAFLIPEFESDSKRYIGQELKSDQVQKPTQKEKLETDLDEKPETDPDKKPDPGADLDEKLDPDPDQRPQPDPNEKLKPNPDEKPDPNPDKKIESDEKLEQDPDKKLEPDPEEKSDTNPDQKLDPDLKKNPRPNSNENPEPDTDKPYPDPDEKPESDPKEKLDNKSDEKPEPDPEDMREPETDEKLEPDPDNILEPESDENPDANPDENAAPDLCEKLDLDPGERPKPDPDLKPEPISAEIPYPDPDQEPDTDLHQESDHNYQFWNPFTILLVTVTTSVTILVVIVGAYHFGKVRARVDMPILINDIEPQIIIPRIRNVRQNPFYSNYV